MSLLSSLTQEEVTTLPSSRAVSHQVDDEAGFEQSISSLRHPQKWGSDQLLVDRPRSHGPLQAHPLLEEPHAGWATHQGNDNMSHLFFRKILVLCLGCWNRNWHGSIRKFGRLQQKLFKSTCMSSSCMLKFPAAYTAQKGRVENSCRGSQKLTHFCTSST